MNHFIFQRRNVALVPIMVFFLARFIFIQGIPTPVQLTPIHLPSLILAKHAAKNERTKTTIHAVKMPQAIIYAAPARTETEVQVATQLMLQSSLRDYHYVLQGNVTCGGNPCAAELRLSIQTDHNPDFKQIIPTDADGHFEYQTIVKENAREPIDWRVTVYTPHNNSTELHGRQILTDDAALTITRTIPLP